MGGYAKYFSVTDKSKNEIYMTNERLEHIYEQHPEMIGFENYAKRTIQWGKRKQQDIDPNIYKYYDSYEDLPDGHTQIVVVVKFEWKIDKNGDEKPNNFVITAYMK